MRVCYDDDLFCLDDISRWLSSVFWFSQLSLLEASPPTFNFTKFGLSGQIAVRYWTREKPDFVINDILVVNYRLFMIWSRDCSSTNHIIYSQTTAITRFRANCHIRSVLVWFGQYLSSSLKQYERSELPDVEQCSVLTYLMVGTSLTQSGPALSDTEMTYLNMNPMPSWSRRLTRSWWQVKSRPVDNSVDEGGGGRIEGARCHRGYQVLNNGL